jgi:high-affinity iron transporter
MLPSFLLSLREGLEAALIIGIVTGTLYKIGRPDMKQVVWAGAASAVVVSVIAAGLLILLGARFEGRAEEIFEGFAMLLAAGILTWMIFWMRAHAETLKTEIEMDVRRAAFRGGAGALFLLAFLSVSREGLELALFLVAAQMTAEGINSLSGALLGLAAAVLLGWVFFATTRNLSLKSFFQVTNVLLILFAAGLVAHGVHELNEAWIIPPIIEHVWDINHVLDEGSLAGQILKALFGYNGNPSLTEVLAYVSYLILVYLGVSRFEIKTQAVRQESHDSI